MKFLCVPCDSPMRLQTVGPPERGSLSVVYSCPECGYEIAMLTNAYETQIVQSLGVRIGPEIGGGTSSTESTSASGTGCPFSAMIPAMESALERTGYVTSTGEGADTERPSAKWSARSAPAGQPPPRLRRPAGASAKAGAERGEGDPASDGVGGSGGAKPPGVESEGIPVRWTAAAEARLAKIPEFVRPMARTGIERFARERGVLEVDDTILDAARDFFGM